MRKAVFAAGALCAAIANAGPLGLEMGTPRADLEKRIALSPLKGNPFVFSANTVPNSHPDLTGYTLLITPHHGLCKVIATTGPIETNGFGDALIEKFKAFERALEAKYGVPSNRFDFVRHGSIWKRAEHWMMGLLKQDRTFSTYWTEEKQALPDKLKSIGLEGRAIQSDVGYIQLNYEFQNVTECLEAMQSQKDSSL